MSYKYVFSYGLPTKILTVFFKQFSINMNIHYIYYVWWLFVFIENCDVLKFTKPQTKQDEARQSNRRQHEDKKVSPGSEKYYNWHCRYWAWVEYLAMCDRIDRQSLFNYNCSMSLGVHQKNTAHEQFHSLATYVNWGVLVLDVLGVFHNI